MALKPIEIVINAKDKASGVFSSLQSKVAAVGVAIGTYFGVKSFVDVVQGAADFEAGMSKVKAATGASAEEMVKLKKAAEDAGANTKFTSTEAAEALTNLGKAGLNAADSLATLPAVLNLAQAGGVGLGEASEYITKAVAGMGLAFKDAGRVADVLALGANATNTSVEGLAQALSYVAPVAQSAGLTLEGTTAILGKLADAGIDASRSGTAMSNMLSQFKDPASQFKTALADAGITTNNFEQALKQLAVAGPKGEKAILAVGLNAGPALRALLNQGMGALDELKVKLEGAAGSAAATAKVMEDNLAGSFKGLSSAWDTVKNVLGTPVLPILKDGVDQLAGAFRNAVADGTVQKFGESIATAFQAGIKWVREFVGTVDFAAVITSLQNFADSAKERFDQFGQYATTAGAAVQTAWGVIQAATSVLMGTLQGAATGIAVIAQGILISLEGIYRASAKITFGEMSAQYTALANDFELKSSAMGAAVDALSTRVRTSFSGVGEGLGNVSAGFKGVTAAAVATGDAGAKAAAVFDDMGKKLEEVRQKTVATEQVLVKKAEATRATAAAVLALREEYAALIARGDLQSAALKFEEINKALAGTPAAAGDAAKAAAEAAAQIDAAFQRLGVTSTAVLKDQAAAALRDYETIRNAGTSSAQDIGAAFKVAADKAIAANNGIAPSWVTAQAAVRGYSIEVDAAGKSTVVSMQGATQAVQQVQAAVIDVSAALRQMGIDAATASEEVKRLAAAGQMLAAADLARKDARNKSINDDQYKNRPNTNAVDAVPTFNTNEEADVWLENFKKQYRKKNPFDVKQKGQLGRYGYDLTMFEYQAERDALELRAGMQDANGGKNVSSTNRQPAQGIITRRIEVVSNGIRTTINTDDAGEDAINRLIRNIGSARGASSIR